MTKIPEKTPEKYSVAYLNNLKPYLTNAIGKLNGDDTHDLPSSGLYKDDEMDPIDEAAIMIDRIVDTLSVNLPDPKQQKIQLAMHKDYMILLDMAQRDLQGFHLYQKMENGLKIIETNSLYQRNNTNINDLVK